MDMPGNLKDRGPRERERVEVKEDWELHYWSDKFGVSREQLKDAVETVGPMAKDVKQYVRKWAPVSD
jgi:hypothetical protein